MRSLARPCMGLLALAAFVAAPASASQITVSILNDNSTCSQSPCNQDSDVFGSDLGGAWNATGGTSPDIVNNGSTSTTLAINAVAAVDGGGDTTARTLVNFDILLDIDVFGPNFTWTLDLQQSVLGLFGLRGDGTATAVGTQSPGSASVSAFTVDVGGNNVSFSASPTSYSNNPSNNGSASQQFSGNRSDVGVLSGTGDAQFVMNVDFDLTAFSNDGCSGFICSSISGGEEAAVLFGAGGVIDQAVDDYGTWGRAQGPDGYNATFTLNVTVPEPATLGFLALGLLGLGLAGRPRA